MFNLQINCLHHYKFDVFVAVIDMQSQELNNRLNDANKTLLVSMDFLCPIRCFQVFNEAAFLKMDKFYPNEFPEHDLGTLT